MSGATFNGSASLTDHGRGSGGRRKERNPYRLKKYLRISVEIQALHLHSVIQVHPLHSNT